MVEITAPPEAAGQRLDRFLATHAGSRAQATRLIDEGLVTVDGAPARKSLLLSGGETITLAPRSQTIEVAGEPGEPRIVFQDNDLLIVDKPAGVVVHPAGGHRSGTLSQALTAEGARGGDPWRPGIVHRLDKDTSGLLVVAKSDEAHRRLKAALQAREIVREYLALVNGRPPARGGTIDAPIGRDRHSRTRVSLDSATPREARTHFTLVEALPGSSLLRVRLETGRTHQIRAHFEAIGHPVVGDPQYGRAQAYGISRQFLHAAHLALAQPTTGEPLSFDSPLPDDLAQALERARRVSS